MRVNSSPGSKERLFEMMSGVNKVKLNENSWQEGLSQTLNVAFDKLKSGALKPEQGGTFSSSMQTINDITYVGINGYDREKNMYNFNFKINAVETGQDDVLNIQDVELEKFSYHNSQGEKVFDVNEDDLTEFNSQHSGELYDVVEQYIDLDPAKSNVGEAYEDYNTPEDNKLQNKYSGNWSPEDIEKAKEKYSKSGINTGNLSDEEFETMMGDYETSLRESKVENKEQSEPFGGSGQDYQDGSGYVDEKPVNSKLRVKSDMLNKYVNEEGSPIENLPKEDKKIFNQAYNNLTRKSGKPKYSPNKDELQKEIDRIKLQKESKNLSDGKFKDFGGVMKWVLNENEESNENVDPELAKHFTFDYTDWNPRIPYGKLVKYDYFGGSSFRPTDNRTNTEYYQLPDGWVVAADSNYAINKFKPYLGGIKKEDNGKLYDRDFNDVTDQIKSEAEKYSYLSDSMKEFIGINNFNEEEVPALDVNDVDNDGDHLEGGLGDDASVMEFDPEQILKGMEVEMEHTKDPKIALEITLDHLAEDEAYYTRLDYMEKNAEDNISPEMGCGNMQTNTEPPDDNSENSLLGFDTGTPNQQMEERYLELSEKDFDSLSEGEKEEFYQLWENFN